MIPRRAREHREPRHQERGLAQAQVERQRGRVAGVVELPQYFVYETTWAGYPAALG